MRRGPFCCEKAGNKNKRTHTVVSTAIAVTTTHASPPRLSQQKNPTWGTNPQSAAPQTRLTGFYSASHWPFCTAQITSRAIPWTASFTSLWNLEVQRFTASKWPGSGMSGEAWTTVSSCIKHMTVTQHGWGPLRRAAARGSWLVWRSTFFPCPRGYCKPEIPYSDMRLILDVGASLRLSVFQFWCTANAASTSIKRTLATPTPFCSNSFADTLAT